MKLVVKKRSHTTNTNEIHKTMRNNYEEPYANKLKNLREMDKFLDSNKLPRLNQEDINNLNQSMINSVIEVVLKYLASRKSLGPVAVVTKFHKNIHRGRTPVRLSNYPKCQASITSILKPKPQQENYRHKPMMNTDGRSPTVR